LADLQSISYGNELPASSQLHLQLKRGIKWLRPIQIAADQDMLGFTKSTKLQNIDDPEEAAQITKE
jgi:hypothetical protein